MGVDFLIRWTQPAGAGEIAWLSTGWEAPKSLCRRDLDEAPQVSVELRPGGAALRFAAKAWSEDQKSFEDL